MKNVLAILLPILAAKVWPALSPMLPAILSTYSTIYFVAHATRSIAGRHPQNRKCIINHIAVR